VKLPTLAAATVALVLGWAAAGDSHAADQTPSEARQPRSHPVLANLAPNTAHDLGPYQCSPVGGEPPERCRLITDYSGMVYDPWRHRMVVFGGGHASTNYDALNTFDLNVLRWVEEYPPTPCSAMVPENFDYDHGAWRSGPAKGPYPRAAARHTTDQLIVLGDELIVLAGVEGNGPCPGVPNVGKYTGYNFSAQPRATHYNFRTRTWTFHAAAGGLNWPGAAYDPPSNKIVLLGRIALEIYDPVAKTKTRAIDLGQRGVVKDEEGKPLPNLLRYNNNLVYFPPNQKLYYFEAGMQRVYEVNVNRNDFSRSTITRLETTGTPPPPLPIGYAYDPVNKVIGGGPLRNVFYAFDPVSKACGNRTWAFRYSR
jgi:hypothetical protein